MTGATPQGPPTRRRAFNPRRPPRFTQERALELEKLRPAVRAVRTLEEADGALVPMPSTVASSEKRRITYAVRSVDSLTLAV